MREILFRGKTADGEWKYGDLLQYENGKKTIINKDDESEVDPATIGQFTGLLGKNGRRVWEGDIVLAKTVVDDEFGQKRSRYIVGFNDGTFVFFKDKNLLVEQWDDGTNDWHTLENTEMYLAEVVGTIHDKEVSP